jgi:hypothetical protein
VIFSKKSWKRVLIVINEGDDPKFDSETWVYWVEEFDEMLAEKENDG